MFSTTVSLQEQPYCPPRTSLAKFYPVRFSLGALSAGLVLFGFHCLSAFVPIVSIQSGARDRIGNGSVVQVDGLVQHLNLLEFIFFANDIGASGYATILATTNLVFPFTTFGCIFIAWVVPALGARRSLIMRWTCRFLKWIMFGPISLFVLSSTFNHPVVFDNSKQSLESVIGISLRPGSGILIVYIATLLTVLYSQWAFDAHYRAESHLFAVTLDRSIPRPRFGFQLFNINRMRFREEMAIKLSTASDQTGSGDGRSLLKRAVFRRARSEFVCTQVGWLCSAVLGLVAVFATLLGWAMPSIRVTGGVSFQVNGTGTTPSNFTVFTGDHLTSLGSQGAVLLSYATGIYGTSKEWQAGEIGLVFLDTLIFYAVGIFIPLLCMVLYIVCLHVPAELWYPKYQNFLGCFRNCKCNRHNELETASTSKGTLGASQLSQRAPELARRTHVNEDASYRGALKRMYEALYVVSFFAIPDVLLVAFVSALDWNHVTLEFSHPYTNGVDSETILGYRRIMEIREGPWILGISVLVLWELEYVFNHISRRHFRMHFAGVERRTYGDGMAAWRSRQEGRVVGVLSRMQCMRKLMSAKKKSVWEFSFDLGSEREEKTVSKVESGELNFDESGVDDESCNKGD